MHNNFEHKLESIARDYHLASHLDMPIENRMQEFEWEWISEFVPRKGNILDLGFGDGISLKNLTQIVDFEKGSICLLEGAESLVSKARDLFGDKVNVIHTLFEEYVNVDSFDFIIASHVFEHVDDPQALLENLYKNARAGAILIGVVPNKDSFHRRLAVLMGIQPELDSLSPRDLLVGHQRVFGVETLKDLFLKSNWTIREFRGFFFKPLSNSQMLDFSPELIEAMLQISNEIPIEMCANIAFVAVKVSE
jgi:2-polyprenyl-3-methyl-5-hydroxy-6-metoxy-1,4-benzoquinol methylase